MTATDAIEPFTATPGSALVVALCEPQLAALTRRYGRIFTRVHRPGLHVLGMSPRLAGAIYVLPDGFRNWRQGEREMMLNSWRRHGGAVVYLTEQEVMGDDPFPWLNAKLTDAGTKTQ